MAPENTLVVRFRVYAPDGGVQGVLPHPLSWEAGIPLNDMPSLTMTYPDGSDAANLLKSPCEVALELRNPATGTFTEYPGCRFINIRRSVDLSDRPRIISFTMPSYGWMLKKVRWMDPDNPRLNKEGQGVYKATMSSATPLVDIVTLAKARGNVPGLTVPFTPLFDSNGDGWPEVVRNVSFDYGQDAWSILDSFSRQGFFDWRMNKRALECFKTDGALKRLLDTDTGVHIHSMLATTEEPVERTWEEVAGTAVAIGDQGLTAGMVVMPDNPTNYPWGKWDEAISAGGVKDVQVLAQITDNLLATKYKARTQYTKKLIWTEGAPVPLVDYRPRDFIRAMSDATSGAQKASMRVYQITLSGTDPYGVGVALTLNDRFTDRALQSERWISRASNGGGPVGGGGTGAGTGKPSPPAVDTTLPKAPVLNSVTNEPYFSSIGDPVSVADVAFTVVQQDINSREIDMSRYIVSARRSDFNWQQARSVTVAQPDSPSTGQVIHAKVPLLDSGFSYEFRVQAVRLSGYVSDYSNGISQTMGYPTEAPPVPSAPILSTKLSTVKAEWNGRDNTNALMPPSFREVQVEVSINNSTWFHVGDNFSGGAGLIMSGKGSAPTWNVGDTVYVRFKAMNSASVISAQSAVSSIVVQGVVGPDIAANTITANNIVAGTLTAEQIKAHSLSVESLSVGNPSNLVVDPTFSSAPLNTARLTQATASSGSGVAWSITGAGALQIDNNSGANNFNRFGFTNNTLVNYPLQTFPGPNLTSNELAIPPVPEQWCTHRHLGNHSAGLHDFGERNLHGRVDDRMEPCGRYGQLHPLSVREVREHGGSGRGPGVHPDRDLARAVGLHRQRSDQDSAARRQRGDHRHPERRCHHGQAFDQVGVLRNDEPVRRRRHQDHRERQLQRPVRHPVGRPDELRAAHLSGRCRRYGRLGPARIRHHGPGADSELFGPCRHAVRLRNHQLENFQAVWLGDHFGSGHFLGHLHRTIPHSWNVQHWPLHQRHVPHGPRRFPERHVLIRIGDYAQVLPDHHAERGKYTCNQFDRHLPQWNRRWIPVRFQHRNHRGILHCRLWNAVRKNG